MWTSLRSENLSLPSSSKVGDLKKMVQKFFGQSFVRLVTAEGRVLSADASLDELQDGDQLTCLAIQPKVTGTETAVAMWCPGGDRAHGAIQLMVVPAPQSKIIWQTCSTCTLQTVRLLQSCWTVALSPGVTQFMVVTALGFRTNSRLCASERAFAAILEDGSVVTWGQADWRDFAGDRLVATERAFAAVLSYGSVVAWGDPDYGGDSFEVQGQLRDVKQLQATNFAFAAISNGLVVTWGRRSFCCNPGR